MTEYSIILALALFFVGATGMILRKNLIVVFMCLELMLSSINLLLITYSRINQSIDAQVFVFFIMLVAACEAAVGLALFISIFRHYKTLDTSNFTDLKR